MSIMPQTSLIQMLERYLLVQKDQVAYTLVKKEVDGVCVYNFENKTNTGYIKGFYETFLNHFVEDFNQYDDNHIQSVKPERHYQLDNVKLINYVVQWAPSLQEFKKYYHLAINKNSVTVSRFIKKYEEALKFAEKKYKLTHINNTTSSGFLQKTENNKACLHYLIAQGMNYNLVDTNNNDSQSGKYILPPVATLHAMRPLKLNYEQFKALTFEHFNNSLNVECLPQAQRLSLANQMMKNDEDRKQLAQCLGVQYKDTYQSVVESDKPVTALYLDNLANMHEYEFSHVSDFQSYMQGILCLLKEHTSELELEDINYIPNAQHIIIFAQSDNQAPASTTLLKKVISQTLVLFKNKKEQLKSDPTTPLKDLAEMFDDDMSEEKLGFKISNVILKCKLDLEVEDGRNNDNDNKNKTIKL